MKFGFSGEAFGNLLLLLGFVAVITSFIISGMLQRRGVDIAKRSVGLLISMGCVIVFIAIPFWLTDLTITQKIVGTILAFGVGIGHYFAIDKMQRKIKKRIDKQKLNNK